MEEKVFNAALAGLLHDIGKVAQRAGITPEKPYSKEEHGHSGYHAVLSDDFVAAYVPKKFQAGLLGVLQHHRPYDESSKIIQLADWWSSGERRQGEEIGQEKVQQSRLIPVVSMVELEQERQEEEIRYRFGLGAWRLNSTNFPQDALSQAIEEDDYRTLWGQFRDEVKEWKEKAGQQWEEQDIASFITTLKALMQKYFWCIPSATPWQDEKSRTQRTYPDVSLIDHARLTSAIAACIAALGWDYERLCKLQESNEEVLLLVRGDISGIQNFIFRVNRPDSETAHAAKRLRGRSFYLSLLNEVLVFWLLQQLELPSTCALFVGGGKFDLLAPMNKVEQLESLLAQVNEWLLEAFQGELNIQVVHVGVRQSDFHDMSQVYLTLEEKLQKSKQKKWAEFIQKEEFYLPKKQKWHVCKVCQLTPLNQKGICPLCNKQEDIGRHLVHTKALVYCKGEVPGSVDAEKKVSFAAPFGLTVILAEDENDIRELLKSGVEIKKITTINNLDGFIYPAIGSSFAFLANTAPKALVNIPYKSGEESITISKGEVCTFEMIAEMSEGAKRLGILKADVDHLGLIMSVGLLNPEKSKYPTISRIAALSSSMEWFFCGYLNEICHETSQLFKERVKKSGKEENKKLIELHEKVDNVFYVMYAGGDDVFVVGPWDATILLAQKLEEEFCRYCCKNPNLTLSAGYVQVKPRYPVQKFADLVDEAEKESKNNGRNRVTLFKETVLWKEVENRETNGRSAYNNLKDLLSFAEEMVDRIESNELSKNILYDLGQVQRRYFMKGDGKVNPMWKPRLLYSLSRRLKGADKQELMNKIIVMIGAQTMLIPVSIASLKIRKE